MNAQREDSVQATKGLRHGWKAAVVVILGVFASSYVAVRSSSQEKLANEVQGYIDDNGEPQIVGAPLNPERVSLVRLIAERERYDGKVVVTQGFFVYAFEQKALYLSREDALYDLSYNALLLDGSLHSAELNEDARATMKKAHMQYVTISGTFHKLGRGHLDSYHAGTLMDMTIYDVRRKAADIPILRTKDKIPR
jgi:hypothetical protein